MKRAIIVDIDGTLAKMNGRGPFEWSRVGEDTVNKPVRQVVEMFRSVGYTIIIFSGRDAVCRDQTTRWLYDNDITYHFLYMRPEGNNEKDAIIKRRLYDQYVNGVFEVRLVLDDRNQVVDMWRKDLGLTCFQVDYGNF